MTFEPGAPPSRTRADQSASAYSRREFFVLALSALGAAASGPGCGKSSPEKPEGCRQPGELPRTVVDLQALLDKYFEHGDITDVRALGRAYIERFGGDECALVDDLSETVRRVADIANFDEAVGALDAAVKGEFAVGGLTSVGGWQLATTETRLCALVEFLAAARG